MTGSASDFAILVVAVLQKTAITRLLGTRPAVVLERVARGGGATNWYYCRAPDDLPIIAASFAPGSCVSFYFDDRLKLTHRANFPCSVVERQIAEAGDAIVGVVEQTAITADIVVSPTDLNEVLSQIKGSANVMYGPFPGRDNDGINAVTLDLPDADGVVRKHPH